MVVCEGFRAEDNHWARGTGGVWRCRRDSANLSRSSVGTESRSASTAWGREGKLQTPGGGDRGPSWPPRLPARSCYRDRRDGLAEPMWGRALSHPHSPGLGPQAPSRGNSRPAAPASRPRPGPLRPARAAVPPFRPPTASLARQLLHSMVLCSAPAALATTGYHSVASGWIWAGSSTRPP